MLFRSLDNVQQANKNIRGTVRLGLPPLMGACFFGDLIPSFYRDYPDIKVSIIEEGAIRIEEMVEDGTLDIALTLNTNRNSNFEKHHFTTQQNVVLLHKDHPLATRKTITMADLKDEQFAIFSDDFILHKMIMATCK